MTQTLTMDDVRQGGAAPAAAPARGRINGAAMNRSIAGTWVKLVLLSWVALIWGALISAPLGIGLGIAAMGIFGLFAVPMWGTVFGFLGMGNAKDATLKDMGFTAIPPEHALHATCAHYCRELGIPMPNLGMINAHNAFAMGANVDSATVALGAPLTKMLTPAEMNAILGHELGHVVSGDMRRMMLMRTFQNATVWFAMAQGLKQMARWVICWAGELMILGFSRKREYWADAIGAALAGKAAMIGALRKLDKAPALSDAENTHARFMFRGKMASAFATHPTMDERIVALEAETYIRQLPRHG